MRHGLLMWLFSQMIVYGYTITKLNMPKLQPATRVSQGWLFAPLIVGGVLMLIYCALNLEVAQNERSCYGNHDTV